MNFDSFFGAEDPALDYVVTHVFFPVIVPEASDYTIKNDHSLARAVCTAAHAYIALIDDSLKPQWSSIMRMLDNVQLSVQSGRLDKPDVAFQLGGMQSGDILAFLIKAQHAAVIFRKEQNCTLYESFEVSASARVVQNAGGTLERSYAGTAIELPNQVFDDEHFQAELGNFLSLPDKVDSDLPSIPAAHSDYITALLTGILRSVGRITESSCILKHVRDVVNRSGEWDESNKEMANGASHHFGF